jgi:hypothetical protein
MLREILKFHSELGEVVILEDSERQYQVEAYYKPAGTYRTFLKTYDRQQAKEVFIRIAQRLF